MKVLLAIVYMKLYEGDKGIEGLYAKDGMLERPGLYCAVHPSSTKRNLEL